MKRRRTIVGCLSLLILIFLAFLVALDLTSEVIGDGSIRYQIKLHSSSAKVISHVGYDRILGKPDRIPALELELLNRKDDLVEFKPIGELEHGRCEIDIPFSERASFLGRTLSYAQFHLLALKVEFTDGSVDYRIVPIPDGRECRTIEAHLK